MQRHSTSGFTLIELMMVVAIVGILAIIAYPSYVDQVRKTRRSDAQAALLRTAQILERCYTEYNAYNNASCAAVNAAQDNLKTTYTSTEGGYYSLNATTLTATTFSLRAAPNGGQSGDRCDSLTYNQVGTKGVTGDADGNGMVGNADDLKICW